MTSYISTFSVSSALRQSVLKMQSELANANQEVSTGNYADIGLSLGAETGESVSLQSQGALLQTITSTNSVVSTRLSTTQTILSSLQTSAQNLLNSLIEGNSSTTNAGDLQAAAQSDLKSMTGSLNTTLNGSYIFAGTNTASQPVTDYYGTPAANQSAVNAAFSSAFGMSQSSANVSTITGSAMQSFLDNQFSGLFQGASWATDWSSATDQTQTNLISTSQTEATSISANETAFKQLSQAYTMVANLGTSNLGTDAYQAVVTAAQKLLTSGINGLTNLQASVGNVQANVSSSSDQMSLQMNILSTQVSNLESVNPYEAATRVTDLQTQIETSYALTSQLHQLSLVNYL